MAYPSVPAGYGFQARNEIGGLPYAGSTRMVPIASGYNTAIGNGDLVHLALHGQLVISSSARIA